MEAVFRGHPGSKHDICNIGEIRILNVSAFFNFKCEPRCKLNIYCHLLIIRIFTIIVMLLGVDDEKSENKY